MKGTAKTNGKNLKRTILFIIIEILIVSIAFLVFIWIKPASKRIYLPMFLNPFLIFSAAWLFISLIISKYNLRKAKKYKDIYIPILISNLTILAVITTLMYSYGAFHFSRMIVFGTIGLTTILELLLSYLYFSFKRELSLI